MPRATKPASLLLVAAAIALLPCDCLAQDSPPLELQHRAPLPEQSAPQTIRLTVPTGTSLEIALDREIRLQRVGQHVHGRLLQPVYAFDKLVIPAGSEATGSVTQIASISVGGHLSSALDANFTPAHKVQLAFDDVLLPDGKHLALQTIVTPGSGNVLDFVAASERDPKNRDSRAAAAVQRAREQARGQWKAAMAQIKSPGKLHRAERYALAQLPVHPQYIDAGSVYFAELQAPLEFGSEPLTPEMMRSLGDLPAEGSVVHARLINGLSSATNQKDDSVEAVITEPYFVNRQLVLPQGSLLSGNVVQVLAARRLHRNGELRLVFHELRLPDGVSQKVEAGLETVEASKSGNVKLDSEGGARANSSKTRYLSTAVAIGLAGISFRSDPDATTPNAAGTTGSRMAGGVVGYKLIGTTLGIFVHSRAFGYSMGAYGAGMSVYSHFISRGEDVVFPANTAMQIGLATRASEPAPGPGKPNPTGN